MPKIRRRALLRLPTQQVGPNQLNKGSDDSLYVEKKIILPRPRGVIEPLPDFLSLDHEDQVADPGNATNQAQTMSQANTGLPRSSTQAPSTAMANSTAEENSGPSSQSTQAAPAVLRTKSTGPSKSATQASSTAMSIRSRSGNDLMCPTDSINPSLVAEAINRLELEKSGKMQKETMSLRADPRNYKKRCGKKNKKCGCLDCRPLRVTQPSDPVNHHELTKEFVRICKLKGLDLSEPYASARLWYSNGKIVPAMKSAIADLTERENKLHETGRLNVAKEKKLPLGGGYITRDQIITYLEDDDRHIREFAELGDASYYGRCLKAMPRDQRKELETIYVAEAVYRIERARQCASMKAAVKRGKMTQEEMDKRLNDMDGPEYEPVPESKGAIEDVAGPSSVATPFSAVTPSVAEPPSVAGPSVPGPSVAGPSAAGPSSETTHLPNTIKNDGDAVAGVEETDAYNNDKEKGKAKAEEPVEEFVNKEKATASGKTTRRADAGTNDEFSPLVAPDFEKPSPDWSPERLLEELHKAQRYAAYLKARQEQKTDEDLIRRIEEEGDQELIEELRTCDAAEAARHNYLIGMYHEHYGDSRWTSKQPSFSAMNYHGLELPWITDRDRVRANIQLMGGSAALAVDFEMKKQIWLGKKYGNGVFQYSDEEGLRLVMAIKYNVHPGYKRS